MKKTIIKGFKFRIYPNSNQQTKMKKFVGGARFVYNHFLANKEENYFKNGITTNQNQDSKKLTALKKEEEFSWLREIHSQVLQNSIHDLNDGYKRLYKGQNRRPKFKSKKKSNKSFRFAQNIIKEKYKSVKIEDHVLYLPGFKKGIKVKDHREINGKILNCTISITKTDKFFASFCCEEEYEIPQKLKNEIGIDLGLKDLAITSDNEKYLNPKTLKAFERKLKLAQRRFSKKKKGSKNREKYRLKVAKIYEKITNIRIDNLHWISSKIINENQVICLEDLKCLFMLKNHKLAKSAADAALSKLKEMFQYKAQWAEREFVLVPPKQTSQRCHCCGWINKGLELKDRTWTCLACQAKHDRDINAAINILVKGLEILSRAGSVRIQACGAGSAGDVKHFCFSSRHLAMKQEAPVFTR